MACGLDLAIQAEQNRQVILFRFLNKFFGGEIGEEAVETELKRFTERNFRENLRRLKAIHALSMVNGVVYTYDANGNLTGRRFTGQLSNS